MKSSTLILLLLFCALSPSAHGNISFDPPEGLILVESKSNPPAHIKELAQYTDADRLIQLSIVTSQPLQYIKEANDTTAGALSGMKRKGFQNEHLSNLSIQGYTARKIVGEFVSSEYEGAFNASTILIFSSNSTYILALSVHETADFSYTIEALAERLSIEGLPVVLKKGTPPPSTNFEKGEEFGKYIAYILFVYIAYRFFSRHSRKKAEQGGEQCD